MQKLTRLTTTVAAVALAVVLAAPSGASATTVINRTVQEMTAVSGLVISGIVTDVVQNQSAPGYPLATRVTIAVDRVFKGFRSGPTISFMIPGGVRDGKVFRIPGMPAFTPGEEVVVFLERTPHGWIPSGLKNGKYTLTADSSGRRVVWRDSTGLGRVVPGMSTTRAAQSEADVMTLEDLEAMIREGIETDEVPECKTQANDGGVK